MDPTPYNSIMPFTDYFGGDNGPFANYVESANGTLIFNSWNTTTLQLLSYKSVMDSFSGVVVGTIYNVASDEVVVNETSVLSTVLSETKELAWLNNRENTFQQIFQ